VSQLKHVTDFPNISGEDTISLTLAAASRPDEVDFILETAASITWWKEVQLRTLAGTALIQVQTQDANHGPQQFTMPSAALVGMRLMLSKAKIFGIHTDMYQLDNLSVWAGRSLRFKWDSDQDRAGSVVGFFKDLGGGIAAAMNAIANVVETVLETVAEALSSVIELIGNALADLNYALGDLLGGPFKDIFHWFGSVLSSVFSFAATVIKAFLDGMANGIVGTRT
jgi:hypothetical protein